MKKTFLLLALVACCFANESNAQVNLSFGVKGGVNVNKAVGSSISSENYLGPAAGVYFRLKVLGFFLQPEVMFSNRGGKISSPAMFGVLPPKTQTISSSYVEVPVMFGKKFFKVLRLNAGPNFQYLVGNKKSDYDYNDFVLGYQAGIGIDVLKFGLDVRYDGNLSKVNSLATQTGVGQAYIQPTATRSSSFQITIAYKLKGIGI